MSGRPRWILLQILGLLALVCAPLALPSAPAQAAATNQRWGYYVTYDATSLSSLRAHVGQLDVVVPYFYTLNSNGTITDFSDPTALSVMRAAGVKIVPL